MVHSWPFMYNDVSQELSYCVDKKNELEFCYQEKTVHLGGSAVYEDDYTVSKNQEFDLSGSFLDKYAKCPFLAYINNSVRKYSTEEKYKLTLFCRELLKMP